jgi:hypothetical protein
VSIPSYDEVRARSVEDWADVPGAPDELHDVPTRCIFCGEFIPISAIEPVLLIASLGKTLTVVGSTRRIVFVSTSRVIGAGRGSGKSPPSGCRFDRLAAVERLPS